MSQTLSQKEQEKLLNEAQKRAIERIQPFQNGGSIACEFSDCTCLIKKQIDVSTMSVIVTPELDIQLVCQAGAEKFMMAQYVNTNQTN